MLCSKAVVGSDAIQRFFNSNSAQGTRKPLMKILITLIPVVLILNLTACGIADMTDIKAKNFGSHVIVQNNSDRNMSVKIKLEETSDGDGCSARSTALEKTVASRNSANIGLSLKCNYAPRQNLSWSLSSANNNAPLTGYLTVDHIGVQNTITLTCDNNGCH